MTLSDQDIRALTYTALRVRQEIPGARRWDEQGTYANIAKIRDRSYAEVNVAVTQAAADRDCETPGIIPSPGSHWQRAATVKVHTPERIDKADRCGICSKARDHCQAERVADDDHVFDNGRRDSIDVHRTIAALRDELAPIAPRTEPTGLDALVERRPELAEAAVVIAANNPGLRNEESA